MAFALGPRAASAGYRILSFDTIGSTSAQAMAQAKSGDPGDLWLAARRQTAGHGRRGRPWETPDGNLAASCLTILPGDVSQPATLGFVAGLSLHDALTEVAPDVPICIGLDGGRVRDRKAASRFALKWPNDVVADGAKIAGILLEADTMSDGRMALVTGIGVNVVAAPHDVPYPATALTAFASAVTAEALFLALSDAWTEHAARWRRDGFAAIRDRWLSVATGLGEPAAIKTDMGVERGRFETIDTEGRLVIRRDDGSAATIAAGDVHFGAAATVRAAP